MTRISAGVHPMFLVDKMLLAEHREIVRIPNTIRSGKAKIDLKKIPTNFKLSTGHVLFFYPRLKYLKNRYLELHKECKERGFDVADYSDAFKDLPENLFNDWEETDEARELVVERINLRLSTMKNIKYNRENINLENVLL